MGEKATHGIGMDIFWNHPINVDLPLKILTFCFDRMQRKVLHQFVMMAKRQMPSRIGDHVDAEDKAAQEGRDYS